MDPDTVVDIELPPYMIRYKSAAACAASWARRGSTPEPTPGPASHPRTRSSRPTPASARGCSFPRTSSKLPLVVYFHGGAFITHSAFSPSHTALLYALVPAARVVAVSVDYRLAPEQPIPAAYDDGWAALCWAVVAAAACSGPEPWLAHHGDLSRLFVAGDSSGANIAHQLALRAGRNGGRLPGGAWIEAMVLMHPYFRGEELAPSEGTDLQRLRKLRLIWAVVSAGKYGLDHPIINPLRLRSAGPVCKPGVTPFKARIT